MSVLLTVATVLGLTALLSYVNERFLGLQQTIGLMVLALGFTAALAVLSGVGIFGDFAAFRGFVSKLFGVIFVGIVVAVANRALAQGVKERRRDEEAPSGER